jgi:hypothetical protein
MLAGPYGHRSLGRSVSTGADPKTMPGTAEFRDGFDRIFGERKPQRGRWVWDEAQQKLVPADEYVPPAAAKNAPIMLDRFMEGAAPATDGTDISSRKKRNEYMRRNGAADKSDYGPGYSERVREARARETSEKTKRTVAEIANLDRRHLSKYLEGKK